MVGSLDFENRSEYRFLVDAIDGGDRSQTGRATVTILVDDFNDIDPMFELPVYTARVSESSLFFESVVQVKVSYSYHGLVLSLLLFITCI